MGRYCGEDHAEVCAPGQHVWTDYGNCAVPGCAYVHSGSQAAGWSKEEAVWPEAAPAVQPSGATDE